MIKKSRQAIIVLGMHRSGTSALAGALGLLGARLPARQLPPQPDNPKGYFESEQITHIHERLLAAAGTTWFAIDRIPDKWFGSEQAAPFVEELVAAVQAEFGDAALFVVKDPRMCRLMPLWRQVLSRVGAEPRFAIALRHPLEVAGSLQERDKLPVGYGCLLWLSHLIEAERETRGARRVFRSFDELLRDPAATAQSVMMQLGIEHRVAADDIASFVDSDMRHHVANVEIDRTTEFYPWLSESYQALMTLTRSPEDISAQRGLDRVRSIFDPAAAAFGPLLAASKTALAERDRNIAALEHANGGIAPLRDALADRERKITELEQILSERTDELNSVRGAVAALKPAFAQVYASASWGVTAPLRLLRQLLRKFQDSNFRNRWSTPLATAKYCVLTIHGAARDIVQRRASLAGQTKRIKRGIEFIRIRGMRAAINRLSSPPPWNASNILDSRVLIDARYASLVAETRERFFGPVPSVVQTKGPKISILMPVYKTPLAFLEAAIESVRRQTYSNWELCIADDASSSAEIDSALRRFSRDDPRIVFTSLQSNRGISAATNAALAMATGEFIGLLDHDDLLTYDALHHVAQVLEKDPDLDLLYSDECKIGEDGQVEDIFAKPDWDQFLLLNSMYTGHFSVYRRALVAELGGFRSDFDFSQDYDLALRITERTSRIHHIERILYGWRRAAGSAAAGDKDFARKSNIAALRSAAERRRYGGNAVALPTGNRVLFNRERSIPVAIIIPSDNEEHIRQSIDSIVANSSYPLFEIIVVTKSNMAASLQDKVDSRVKFCAYDDAFNFSAKCNAGTKATVAPILLFFNDDVRVISRDWIECLLEYLALEGVGAVAPKMLYEDDTIQHAGIVTGVRRLLGTAFHCLPSDTTAYFNLAQSVHNVSVLSGACLAVRRAVFDGVAGFDAERYPIAHSDVDFCLKIRRANLQCIYTPFANLRHIGHASLKLRDADRVSREKDRADIHLLQDWPHEIARDPFWTPTMRDLLYADSPEYFEVFPPFESRRPFAGKNILLVFHDLSNSGAPRALFEAARHLIADGHFIVAASPSEGYYRDELRGIGATVIVDELLLCGHPTVYEFARNFDFAIVNTVVCWPFILQNAAQLDCYWYLHESGAIADYAKDIPKFCDALHKTKAVWVNGVRAKNLSKNLRPDMAVVEPGIAPTLSPPMEGDDGKGGRRHRMKIGVFGSYEPRKGQDLAVAAIQRLPESLAERFELNFFGRILDQRYLDDVKKIAIGNDAIKFGPELTHADCVAEMVRSDLVLIPSRDESMSLVGLDAIGAGKIVVCSTAVGLSSYLRSGESGFIAKSPAPEHLASAIAEALLAKADWGDIGANARRLFDRTFTEAAFRERIYRALPLA